MDQPLSARTAASLPFPHGLARQQHAPQRRSNTRHNDAQNTTMHNTTPPPHNNHDNKHRRQGLSLGLRARGGRVLALIGDGAFQMTGQVRGRQSHTTHKAYRNHTRHPHRHTQQGQDTLQIDTNKNKRAPKQQQHQNRRSPRCCAGAPRPSSCSSTTVRAARRARAANMISSWQQEGGLFWGGDGKGKDGSSFHVDVQLARSFAGWLWLCAVKKGKGGKARGHRSWGRARDRVGANKGGRAWPRLASRRCCLHTAAAGAPPLWGRHLSRARRFPNPKRASTHCVHTPTQPSPTPNTQPNTQPQHPKSSSPSSSPNHHHHRQHIHHHIHHHIHNHHHNHHNHT